MSLDGNLCWVMTDGSAGMENQALGLAESLGFEIIIKHIILRCPWTWIAPYIRIGKKYCLHKNSDQLRSPWPDFVIACGRKSILPALYVKEKNFKTKLIYLQDPKISPKYFDAIICPKHDKIEGDNVIKSCCSIHRISEKNLSIGKSQFEHLFATYKSPRIGVLIGGTNHVYKYSKETTIYIANKLISLCKNDNVSLLVTTSRRTPERLFKILKEKFIDYDNIYLWDRTSPNPYFGILALSDILILTPDSISMISEAASTDKPIYIIPIEGGSKKFNLFHNYLLERKRVRWLENHHTLFKVKKINEIPIVVKKLKKLLSI